MAEEDEPDSPITEAKAVATGEVVESIQSGQARESPELPEELRHLAEKRIAQEIQAKRDRDAQEIKLRQTYAQGLMRILSAQLVVTDLVFVVFAWAGKNWALSDTDINIWLGATVVQVVGVVLVVTRHLFPQRDDGPLSASVGSIEHIVS